MTMASDPHQKISRKKIWLVALIILVLVISGIGYAVQKLMTGPAIGTVITNLPAASPPAEVELQQFDGTHFYFAHPMTYIEQPVKPQPNVLESRSFVSSGMTTKSVTINITKFPSNQLEDDPSYVLRKQNPAKYQMKPLVIKNEKVVIATDTSGQEFQQIAFWVHGGKLMTLTMSGVSTDPKMMAAEHETMVSSVSWR